MRIIFQYDILDEVFTLVKSAPEADGSDWCPPDVYNAFGGRVVLANYSGNISLAEIDKFKPSLFETLSGESQQIIIGLANIAKLSRTALGALVDFASAVLGRGKTLYLLSPSKEIMQALNVLQLNIFFEVLHDENDLLYILPDE